MSEKFTKGPWGVSECRTKETKYHPHKGQEWVMEMLEIAAFKKDSDKLVCVARIDHRVNRLSIDEEDIANANLIAAAPDMYEALEEVWRILDSTMPLSRDNRADRIKRILRKARGETE